MDITSNHASSVLVDPAPLSNSSHGGVHSSLLPYPQQGMSSSSSKYITIPRRKPAKFDDVRSNGWLDAMKASSPPRKKMAKDFNLEIASEDFDTSYISWMLRYPSALRSFEHIINQANGRKIAIFLDYDGTLSPIVDDPDFALMSDDMRSAVKNVARHFPTAIISGRSRNKVYDLVGLTELYYAGSHGMDIMGPVCNSGSDDHLNCLQSTNEQGKEVNLFQPAREFLPVIDEVFRALVESTKGINGAKVENHKFCASVHYRNVEEKNWPVIAQCVHDVLKGYPHLRLTHGRKVLEYFHLSSNPSTFTLVLSNLDLLSGRFPVTYFYFYRRPSTDNFTSIVETLKSSLAITLNHFYPFAGRIVQNLRTNEPEIVCDNTGALLFEAHADIALKEIEFYNLDQFMKGKLVNIDPAFAMQVQVTRYSCGGTSITFTFDHALGDASAFSKFLISWSEIAQNKQISCMPDHRRSLQARSPPTYHPSLNQAFAKCTIEEILNIPTKDDTLLKRLYHIDVASIDHLQKLASSGGQRRTKIEALSAYIWKVMVSTIGESHKECKMGWLVDGRTRLCGDSSMSNYIGNVLSLAVGEAGVGELKDGSLSEIANRVHDTISKVTNRDHFLDLIDWIECHRPGLMLSRVVLGRGGPTLVLSSGRRFPVTELDFGFGSPILGTVCSTIERIGVAYMNQRSSARNDGSWTVSAMLWPKLATLLESDPIFQPMSAKLLQL